MTIDRKYDWITYLNPEGTRKFKKVGKAKKKLTEVPPEPETPDDFLHLSKVKPIQDTRSTHAAHVFEALEEKEK